MGLYRTGMSQGGGGGITVDDQLSTTSTNPVQNRVITNALSDKQPTLTAGSGININNNTISVDGTSTGYQKYINFDVADVSQWAAGTEGQLQYAVMANGSKQLYRYTNNAWERVYEINVNEGNNVNNPLTNIIISTTDIGEGASLPSGTIYLVVE